MQIALAAAAAAKPRRFVCCHRRVATTSTDRAGALVRFEGRKQERKGTEENIGEYVATTATLDDVLSSTTLSWPRSHLKSKLLSLCKRIPMSRNSIGRIRSAANRKPELPAIEPPIIRRCGATLPAQFSRGFVLLTLSCYSNSNCFKQYATRLPRYSMHHVPGDAACTGSRFVVVVLTDHV